MYILTSQEKSLLTDRGRLHVCPGSVGPPYILLSVCSGLGWPSLGYTDSAVETDVHMALSSFLTSLVTTL